MHISQYQELHFDTFFWTYLRLRVNVFFIHSLHRLLTNKVTETGYNVRNKFLR